MCDFDSDDVIKVLSKLHIHKLIINEDGSIFVFSVISLNLPAKPCRYRPTAYAIHRTPSFELSYEN